jgi:hypothetical protein
MSKDRLVPVPMHVAASLLAALASLPPRREARLVLKRLDYERAPTNDRQNDYDVLFGGEVVGRVWRHEYRLHPWEGWLWHWRFRRAKGGPHTDGHAETLDEALGAFRKAWDSAAKSGVA